MTQSDNTFPSDPDERRTAVIVAVQLPTQSDREVRASVDELRALLEGLNVEVVDTLPADVTFVSATGGTVTPPSGGSNDVVVAIGDIDELRRNADPVATAAKSSAKGRDQAESPRISFNFIIF